MPLRSLTLAFVLLAACGPGPEPETVDPPAPDSVTAAPEEAPPPFEIEGADDLLGRWVILEQAGTAPEDRYHATFTRGGEYIVENEAGPTRRAEFRLAGDRLITVTDSTGTRRFVYDVNGRTLTLTVPGTETRTVLERR